MRTGHVIVKRFLVPIITIALLLGSWAPRGEVQQAVSESKFGNTAIVEMYRGAGVAYAAQAARVNWDTVAKSYNVKVYVDGKDNEIQFTQSTGRPFIAKDRTFVPYRIMSEALGARVDWNNDARKVTAEGNGNKVELFIGSKTYGVNGAVKTMDVEPFILSAESRTYIPARYLTEGLSYTIDFAQDGQVMYICSFTKGQNEAQRKAILNEIVQANKGVENSAKPGQTVSSKNAEWIKLVNGEPRFIIKDGKLADEQVQLVKDVFKTGKPVTGPGLKIPTLEWVSPDKVYNHDAYVKEIQKVWGGKAIIDDRLISLIEGYILDYYVVTTDGKLWSVHASTNMDGTIEISESPISFILKHVM